MATKIFNKYSPRANAPDTDYPYGSIKNETVAGANDGTPLDQEWANDYEGYTQALLAQGNVVPSGDPDTVLVSDRMIALNNIISKAALTSLNIIYPIGSTKEFYSATDPNPNTLSGYNEFTWVRVADGLVCITVDASRMGTTAGTQASVNDSVGDTTLTVAQLPEHTHSYAGGFENVANSPGTKVLTASGTSYTTPSGGGLPHTHALDLQTAYYSKWVRTA